MKKIILALIIMLGFTVNTYAQNKHIEPISESKIKRMDHQYTKHKAVKRNFKTQKEFKRAKQRKVMHKKVMHKSNKYITSKSMRYDPRSYDNGARYDADPYRDEYRPIRQRGYNHTKRGWILAYQYDRASFYDNEGFYYGYFNRHGYYFEDVFYRYDRYYTYRDRVRGRGLFDNRYYMPANAQYYGFATRYESPRSYERGFNRGYNRY